MSRHFDEAALLSYSAGVGSVDDRNAIASHLAECTQCRRALDELARLDVTLRELAESGELSKGLETTGLDVGDPFRLRPPIRDRSRRISGLGAIQASEFGLAHSGAVLESLAKAKQPDVSLRRLALDQAGYRFALYYALQEAAKRIAEGPARALHIAEAVLAIPSGSSRKDPAEAPLAWSSVRGQAHLLAAQANLWQRAFSSARLHLIQAFRDLAKGSDESALAVVELTEAQRRAFTGDGREGLELATRARLTFEERGLVDLAARACVAEGLALSALGDFDGAIRKYREALPTFEALGLWSNYVGAVNSLATALYRSGRLSEAKREFARVFRRLSREEHHSWLGYVREGLGDVLVAAGRYREAATALERAAELYEQSGLIAGFLKVSISAAECLARSGRTVSAADRLDLVSRKLADDRSLEAPVRRALLSSLRKCDGTIEEIAGLRSEINRVLAARS